MGRTNQNIIQHLDKLDFQFGNSSTSSIFFVSDLEMGKDLHPKIILDLDKAKLFKVDAVYFRFFDGGRLPQPQIYIYDNVEKSQTNEEIAEIHRAIWSASEIPMFIVLEKSKVKIFDGRQPITIKQDKLSTKPIDEIDLDNLAECSKIIDRYKAQKFDNGNFWESDVAQRHFLNNKTAYEKLIGGLKSMRTYFKSKRVLSSDLADHLLILTILIKYLEENGKEDDGTNLAGKFFFEKTGYSSFEEIIRSHKIETLFDELSGHFNGGLFKLTEEQKLELKDADLSILASFLEGKLRNNQFVIWQEYSFKFIPVELISNFYEEFLPKEKKAGKEKEIKVDTGAVYTPGFLVNFLVDECLPLSYNDLNENVKLADVSCGSGIFLSTCYKRLVQRWRIKNAKNGKLADTNPEILKSILLQNIFGVDVDKNAVELTIFSLNLTLCTMLTPRQIWTQLKFNDLKESKNIVKNDFFEYLVENKPSGFDLVIGNPPFVRKKLIKGKSIEEYSEFLTNSKYPIKYENPMQEFALLFLEKAMHLLKKNGLLCLILPSGPLLYFEDSHKFRKDFFKDYNIPQIFDLTYFRRILFKATVPTLALFVEKKEPDTTPILHIAAQRTKTSKERRYFEIDHYDLFEVPKEVAHSKNRVWKSNLVGGARVFNLIDRLKSSNTSISQFLKNNDEIKYKGTFKRKDIDYLKNKVLFRKAITKGNFPQIISESYFLNNKVEACGFEGNSKAINDISDYLFRNQNLFCFHIAATSGRQGLRGAYTIIDNDIFCLPLSFDLSEIKLSLSEKIIVDDVVNYRIELFGQGENAKINQTLTGIEKHEVITTFEEFSNIYCTALNSIYQDGEKKYALSKIIEGEAFFACEYVFTEEVAKLETSNSENDFEALIDHWDGRNALIKRVVRFYGDNKIILIKPKQLRYWLKSIALRDADETLEEAFNQTPKR